MFMLSKFFKILIICSPSWGKFFSNLYPKTLFFKINQNSVGKFVKNPFLIHLKWTVFEPRFFGLLAVVVRKFVSNLKWIKSETVEISVYQKWPVKLVVLVRACPNSDSEKKNFFLKKVPPLETPSKMTSQIGCSRNY